MQHVQHLFLWDKPEVEIRFQRCVISDIGSFQALVAQFFNIPAQNSILSKN